MIFDASHLLDKYIVIRRQVVCDGDVRVDRVRFGVFARLAYIPDKRVVVVMAVAGVFGW